MNQADDNKQLYKKAPIYIIGIILLCSFIVYTYFFFQHPGSNFIQPTDAEIQQQLENGEISERIAMLREHTWKYGSRDAYLYTKMANQIIEDGVYGYNTDGKSNAFVTPGYPIILVVLFHIANILDVDQMTVVKLFNMLLSLGTILLIYLIGAKTFANRWIGIVASALYAAYFTPLHYFRTSLTEIPGIFFFCLAIYLFLLALEKNNKIFHFLFAVVFCYGVMIRPVIAPLVLIAFAILLVKYRHQLKTWIVITGVWAFGAAVIIAPWVIRNFIMFNEFILLSTHSGNSWFAGSNPFDLYSFSDYWKEQAELGMDSKEYAIMKIKEGFENNFGLWFAWFTVGKTYELFKLPDAIYFYTAYSYVNIFKLIHNIIVNLAFITTIVSFITRKKEAIAIAAILIMYIGLSNLFLTIPRYGFFIIPIMCILGGYAIVTIIKKVVNIIQGLKVLRG
ncbi:glycosyltransferase family 39 protein [Virgibacillus sp. AGTR]|uniref:ArnT family glycosyltransferase n=1 Tax=unclassified Virgibacillus TaxID=2620237 RepID=UPI000EF47EFC|nr:MULTISPECIES: glycosyltransferase family 39 protein [unclassified Virgibacillus]MCC2250626.1 glycosyltransferase family 39 protein [Virgibacillus sp. AGTR]QRZ18458.1 glycosyltransferase family 39 protein [Virgibacillus sp. AGTR]